jgi:putative thioredoxin
MIADANETTFDDMVLERSCHRPVIVVFTAPWCHPCRRLEPLLTEAAKAHEASVDLITVDFDENPRLARRFRIWGVPAVRAFRNGKIVSKFTGMRSREAIQRLFRTLANIVS